MPKQPILQLFSVSMGKDGFISRLLKRQEGTALIPSPKNGVCNGIDEDRDRAILDIRILEGDKIARSI